MDVYANVLIKETLFIQMTFISLKTLEVYILSDSRQINSTRITHLPQKHSFDFGLC